MSRRKFTILVKGILRTAHGIALSDESLIHEQLEAVVDELDEWKKKIEEMILSDKYQTTQALMQ